MAPPGKHPPDPVESLRVDVCWEGYPWPPDSDIAGLGVLIAFGTTSMITLIAIVIGYFTNAIPSLESEPSAQTTTILHKEENTENHERNFSQNKLDEQLIRVFHKIIKVPRGPDDEKPRGDKKQQAMDKRKRDSFENFILTLSDQQLITGLAILIIGFLRRRLLSSYHFIIITCMAWFSSVTHLSSLTVLEGYFEKYTRLKYARLLAMLTLFIMLFIALLAFYSNHPFQVSLQCRFEHMQWYLNRNEAIKDGVKVSDRAKTRYICAVCVMFTLSATWLWKSMRLLLPVKYQPKVFRNDKSAERRSKFYADKLERLSRSNASATSQRSQRYIFLFSFVYAEFFGSFLWQIVWLYFLNFYGIRQLFWAKQIVGGVAPSKHRKFQEKERELGFGQLLALLLLALPLLAAIETYTETSKDIETITKTDQQPLNSQELGTMSSNLSEAVHNPAQETRIEANQPSNEDNTLHLGSNMFLAPTARTLYPSPSASSQDPLLDQDDLQLPTDIALDLYSSPIVWRLFLGLFTYTLVTLTLLAYYEAWEIRTLHEVLGIKISLSMALALIIAGIGPFWQEVILRMEQTRI